MLGDICFICDGPHDDIEDFVETCYGRPYPSSICLGTSDVGSKHVHVRDVVAPCCHEVFEFPLSLGRRGIVAIGCGDLCRVVLFEAMLPRQVYVFESSKLGPGRGGFDHEIRLTCGFEDMDQAQQTHQHGH